MLETEINIVSSFLMFIAAVIPIYMIFKLNGVLKKLTIILSIFIVIHGLYHIFLWNGFEFIPESILEPASAIILVIFGLLFLRILKKKVVIP